MGSLPRWSAPGAAYWRRFALAALIHVGLSTVVFLVIGWGRPSLDILLGGIVGYAAIALVVVSVLRPRSLVGYVSTLVLCCVALRLVAFLPHLGVVDERAIVRFLAEQVFFVGLSSAIAFLVSGRYWDGKDSDAPSIPLYREKESR